MKILHLNFSDTNGGAARAAYRLHSALINIGVQSELLVCEKNSNDNTVKGPKGFLSKFWMQFRVELIAKLFNAGKGSVYRSCAILPSKWVHFINKSDADLVNLHWINGEMLSIRDINLIKKPIVWTLHDMWAFLGADHLTYDDLPTYELALENVPYIKKLLNQNSWTYGRKKTYWKRPLQIVCPSHWLSQKVCQSSLMKSWPVEVIPNCLDLSIWKPVPKSVAQNMLNLPKNKKFIMFGSFRSNDAYHKGKDLLSSALRCMPDHHKDLEIIILGKKYKTCDEDFDYPCHYIPHLHDDISLVTLYSSVDVVAVPSRIESFCQVASEAQACGVPVVAFKTGGLIDIIKHKKTGYLAETYSVTDFAKGISWLLCDEVNIKIKGAVRSKMLEKFSYEKVAMRYLSLYKKVLEE